MSVKKNFLYNLSYQLLLMILPFITTPYISRVIGAEGVGIQAYTISIANYFVLFAMLGINNHGNRSIAMVRGDKDEMSKSFWSIYLIQFIMATFMIILYCIYFFRIAKEYKLVFSIQVLYLIGALLDINWFFFGMEKFKLTVVRNTIVKLVSVLSIFIFVKKSSDIYIYSFILAAGSLISQIILWNYLFKYIKLTYISFNDIKKHFKPIIVLFLPVIAISIYKIMDKIMLGMFSDVVQVGFYENSEKIINIPLGIIAALGTVMLPKISNLISMGCEEESKKYIRNSMKFAMFTSIGSMFGLIGISDTFIPIFLGEEFNSCSKVVSLLAVTIIFIAWANVLRTQFLIPKKKDKVYIISTFLGAVVNVSINLLLIAQYGAIGATIGTIFAEGTVAIYQTLMIRKEIELSRYLKESIFFIIPGSIMCFVLIFIGEKMGSSILTGIVQIIVGGLIYVSISLVYFIFNKYQESNFFHLKNK